jgi:pantoate--beta-alanine ligase
MKEFSDNLSLHNFLEEARQGDKVVGFVPTMGALHAGHLSLVEEARQESDIVVVSIFVNPTQFAPHEDFESYPRDIKGDAEKLAQTGADVLWLPTELDIYPEGKATDTHISGVSGPLEGECRPHFFDGVATVVRRLFLAVEPDKAFFGEKDFQQLQVIKKLVRDYDFNIDIIGVPTVRDENGLALSSRNAYLNKEQYDVAVQLNKILKQLAAGDINEIQAREKLLRAGFDRVDYCTARNAETFLPDNPDRVLAAAWIGGTRLIDNMPVGR